MICLDTNYLVCSLVPGTHEADAVEAWLQNGEKLFAPSVAWYEFQCGPVNADEVLLVRAILTGGLIPFEEAHAEAAARLFNAIGRVRRLRVDAMIASSAMVAGCRLATSNLADFKVFVPFGLVLV
jgi:predicted nucleic acid-binding protein